MRETKWPARLRISNSCSRSMLLASLCLRKAEFPRLPAQSVVFSKLNIISAFASTPAQPCFVRGLQLSRCKRLTHPHPVKTHDSEFLCARHAPFKGGACRNLL